MAFKPTMPQGGFRSWATGEPTGPRLAALPSRGLDPNDVDDLQEMLATAKEAGDAEARAELEAELVQLREVAEAVGPVVEELETLRRRTLMDTAESIADVVRLFARRVVGDALAMNPEALSRLVVEAIAQLPERDELTIAVNAEASDALLRSLPANLRDRVVVEPEITAGAIVRTRNASLDATLATAEQGLEGALQEWLTEQWWVESSE